jgi:hypothetical protein
MLRKLITTAAAVAALASATLATTASAQAGGYGYGYGNGYGYGGYGGYVQVYRPQVYYPTCTKYVTYDHYGNPVWVKSCH